MLKELEKTNEQNDNDIEKSAIPLYKDMVSNILKLSTDKEFQEFCDYYPGNYEEYHKKIAKQTADTDAALFSRLNPLDLFFYMDVSITLTGKAVFF